VAKSEVIIFLKNKKQALNKRKAMIIIFIINHTLLADAAQTVPKVQTIDSIR